MVVAAPFQPEGYHRVMILKIFSQSVRVFYIDHGTTSEVFFLYMIFIFYYISITHNLLEFMQILWLICFLEQYHYPEQRV